MVKELCGFGVKAEDYTWDYFIENDWYRYEKLVKLGVRPFVMKWNGRRDIKLLNAFSRWVNHLHKVRLKKLEPIDSFTSFLKHEYKSWEKERCLNAFDGQVLTRWKSVLKTS